LVLSNGGRADETDAKKAEEKSRRNQEISYKKALLKQCLF